MKIILKLIFFFLIINFYSFLGAQSLYSALARPETDILHYQFTISINDTNNLINGETRVEVKFIKSNQKFFSLDLVQLQADGSGMKVSNVVLNNKKISFEQLENKINISFPDSIDYYKPTTFIISYSGIPTDGLIISKNKFGERTFFGDNWPNRAHYWIPVKDHPSDKATCDFIINAPDHYKIISNGKLISEEKGLQGSKKTIWKESVPIATKVMVFGAADFVVDRVNQIDSVEIQSWAFQKDKNKIFSQYHNADKILTFFKKNIGKFSYEKLANVQSKTRFGGMENAGCIFYNEVAETEGKTNLDNLLSHEIAHQWFGNSITEKNWQHIWLSEGFATYFSALYIKDAYGMEEFNNQMQIKKEEILLFNSQMPDKIIIDSTEADLMNLLNVNSYQKGAWVLHMLKHELGDKVFWDGIRKYYMHYKNGNANTDDFKKVMEIVSAKKLSIFFKQWLYTPTIPEIKYIWMYESNKKIIKLKIKQVQTGNAFNMPVEIGIKEKGKGELKIEKVNINNNESDFSFHSQIKPEELIIDPYNYLLIKRK